MIRHLPQNNHKVNHNEIRLKFSDKPSEVLNPSTNYYLNNCKMLIDKNRNEWDNIKKYTNEYEFIGSIIPGTKQPVSKFKPLSRAFYKLVEIYNTLNIGNMLYRQPLETFHLAEGPGGFIEAICFLRNNSHDRYHGMTLINDSKSTPGWKKSRDFLINNTNVYIETGADGTGNLYSTKNLELCIRKYKNSMMLITGDGGIDFSVDYNEQETQAIRLIFTQIVYALHMQKQGGIFILKIFDSFTKATQDMIYLLSTLYESITVIKPKSSRMANSEKYIVCKNFLYRNIDHISLKLVQIIKLFENINHEETFVDSFLNIPCQRYFKSKITDINAILTQQQITTIFKTIKLIENKERKIDKINKLRQLHVQKCIKWCSDNKIPHNVETQKTNIFLSRASS